MIYLDLTILSVQRVGGISTVWREYVRRLGEEFGAGEVTLLVPVGRRAEGAELNEGGFAMQAVAPRGRVTKYAPLMLRGQPHDVLHTSYYQGAPRFRGRRVVTVHDLTHRKHGYPAVRMVHDAAMERAVDAADVVVTPSEATAGDLRRLVDYSGHLEVVPHAVDIDTFYPEEDESQTPYCLWVGRRDWYRDYAAAVSAVKQLRREVGDLELRVVGDRGKGAGPVVHEGYVGRQRLRQLYSGALALFYLSYSEGFGLPILEAQACGCPVVCYEEKACRETAGSGALFTERGGVADAVRDVLDGDERDSLAERGRANVERFGWGRTVGALAGIYRSLTA